MRLRTAKIGLAMFVAAATNIAFSQSNLIYTDLHDFGGSSGPDGVSSLSVVTFDSAGNMYGTAAYGGLKKRGMVWEITKAGKYLDLHDFGGIVTSSNGQQGPDGEIPFGPVAVDGAGNLFGTTAFGGPNGSAAGYSGVVWEITKAGKYIDLHDFGGYITTSNGSGGSDGGNPCSGVTLDAAGNLYGTASAGGPYYGGIDGAGMVWEITKSGQYLDLHDFGGTVTNADGSQGPDGYMSYASVSVDAAGNLFGTASKRGPKGGGMVWEIAVGGNYFDLHDFGGQVTNANGSQGPDGQTPYSSVAFDKSGNLFGTTVAGGAYGPGMVWKISATGAYSDIHDFGGTVTNANGAQGPDGRNSYAGVAFNAGGDMIGTAAYGGANDFDGYSAGMVWEISRTGAYVDLHDFGGKTTTTAGTQGFDGNRPFAGVTFDVSGNVYGISTYGGPNGETGLGTGAGMVWSMFQSQIRSIAVSPTAVIGGTGATGTVTLAAPAPWTGLLVPLSVDSSSATVPTTVTVAGGASTATFPVTTVGVASQSTVVVKAGAGTGQMAATLTINPAELTALTLDPSSVGGGETATGTVTLSGPAGPSGTTVSLVSSSPSATVPSTAIVPAGQSSGTFTIATKPVATSGTATITATLGGKSLTKTLTIGTASLALVSANPSSVTGGTSSTGMVNLSAKVFSGSFIVTLSSSDTSVSVPKSVTVPAGSDSASFVIATKAVSTQKTVTLTAKNGTTSKTVTIAVGPPTIKSLSLSPSTIAPGGSSTGTVTLSGPAPTGGIVVILASTPSGVTMPSTVKIAAGQTAGTFSITSNKSIALGPVTISATVGISTQTSTLTIS